MENYKCKKMTLVNAINLSECNTDLLAALGWDKGDVDGCVKAMSEANWLNKDYPGEPQSYDAWKCAQDDMQEAEKAVYVAEWRNGDKCAVDGYSYIFVGVNPCNSEKCVLIDEKGYFYSQYFSNISRPESADQKAEKEREEKAIKLREIVLLSKGSADAALTVRGKRSIDFTISALIDAGIKLPSDES